ncbi:MAG: UDP-N-acetylglucosamine 2-epimerase (non-hydrolyzing), partial [Candidatus Electrothrix sp. ATG2]|nr:UDP-N-acetylglucosamine 2-epimerase (non-hydrolyzing) [Candidatus Electrothrix sp. ATG2]
MKSLKVLFVVGTRPNFVKITQFFNQTLTQDAVEYRLVHTGQHYDAQLSDSFFQQFGIVPDYFLNIGQGTPSRQIADVIRGIEDVLKRYQADIVMAVGDVNSTLAAAVAANKCGIKVAHIESGLRSYDRSMPEEINRVAVDHIADYLFVTEQSGIDNLLKEGIQQERMFLVGNTMIDTLVAYNRQICASQILDKLQLDKGNYGLVTIHRPSNVDRKTDLVRTVELLNVAAQTRKILFPVHPRTAQKMRAFGLNSGIEVDSHVILCEPLSYFDFQHLLMHSQFVLTDSGGIQEETTFRQKPCITLRPNTERPITLTEGTNVLCDFTPEAVSAHIQSIDSGYFKQ